MSNEEIAKKIVLNHWATIEGDDDLILAIKEALDAKENHAALSDEEIEKYRKDVLDQSGDPSFASNFIQGAKWARSKLKGEV